MDRAADYAYCEALLRRNDHDRWLASLFLPSALRPHVIALYAFSHEIARVRARVQRAAAGRNPLSILARCFDGRARREMRRSPRRCSIRSNASTCRARNSSASSMRGSSISTTRRCRASRRSKPMPRRRPAACFSLRLSSSIPDARRAAAARHAGIAYAVTGLLRGLPWQIAAGQTYVPRELYAGRLDLAYRPAGARCGLGEAAGAGAPESARLWPPSLPPKRGRRRRRFCPAALCELYLRQMEKPGYDPLDDACSRSRRQWRRAVAALARGPRRSGLRVSGRFPPCAAELG